MITRRLRKEEIVCSKCKYCGGKFADKDSLKTHIQVDHEKSKQFRCFECKTSFGWKTYLEHMNSKQCSLSLSFDIIRKV